MGSTVNSDPSSTALQSSRTQCLLWRSFWRKVTLSLREFMLRLNLCVQKYLQYKFGRACRRPTTSSQPNSRFVLEVDFLATVEAVLSGRVRLCCLLAWLAFAVVFLMLKQFYRASFGDGQAQCLFLPLLLNGTLGKSF